MGDFRKFLVTKFVTKVAQKIANFLHNFVKPHSGVKSVVATFWAFLKHLGYFVLQHMVTLVPSFL